MTSLENIRPLLINKADLQIRLFLIPYTGTPEIKENKSGKYLYMRERVNGKLSSQYIGKFTVELYRALLNCSKEARELRKEIKKIDSQLALLGYTHNELLPEVQLNLDFAKANEKTIIYEQAVLEEIHVNFEQTEAIVDDEIVNGVRSNDVLKILNLKHSWKFILDEDVIQSKTDFYMLSYIAKLVNEGFSEEGGRIRRVPVTIRDSVYIPPIPDEIDVRESINNIVSGDLSDIDKGIELCLYTMKTQVFNDGNKRAAVIFANHYLISHGCGLLVIPEKEIPEFKKLLIEYCEDRNTDTIRTFLNAKCWRRL